MDKSLWSASLFLLIIGLIALAGGGIAQLYQWYRDPGRERVRARVVDLILREPEGETVRNPYKNVYYPVFEYYMKGRLYKVTHSEGAYPSPYHINQEVQLCCDREDPEQYELAERNTLGILSGVLYGVGVACLCVACLCFARFALRR